MVWSRQLETEIILPSDATPGPGSGVFYIGPNLPTEMEALGYTSAIIWYSDAEDYANSHVEYQFIGYRPSVSPILTQAMDVIHGMKRDGIEVEETQVWEGAIAENPIVNVHAQFTADDLIAVLGPKLITGALNSNATDTSWTQTNNVDNEEMQVYTLGGILGTPFGPTWGIEYRPPGSSAIEQNTEISLGGFGNLLNQMLMTLEDVNTFNEFSHILLKILQSSGIIELAVGSRVVNINNNGTKSWLTDNDPTIDVWQGPFSNAITTGGVNGTLTYWSFTSYDRMVTIRGQAVWTAPPPSQQFAMVPTQAMPTPLSPGGNPLLMGYFLNALAVPMQISNAGTRFTVAGAAAACPGNTLNFYGSYPIGK